MPAGGEVEVIIKLICKKCGMEKKLMGFYNNYQDKLLPHILCKCPHYDTGEKL